MQSSLRLGGDNPKSKTLKLHAKERFLLDSNTLLQGHAELDTDTGVPSYLAFILRHFYPESSASIGVGVQRDKKKVFEYIFRAKKEFLIDPTGHLRFNVKARCNIDKEFSKYKARGAAELCLYKFDFQKDQDVRLKAGYEIAEKVPYFQISENNWTFNVDINGNWNVRFHL